jgi:putative flippase GtrA
MLPCDLHPRTNTKATPMPASQATASVAPEPRIRLWHIGSIAIPARELLAFVIVGVTSALLYVTLNVAFAVRCGVRPGLAIVLTLALLMPPTYLAQRGLTFRSSRPHRAAFPRYVATQAIGNLVGIAGAELGAPLVSAFPWAAFTAVAVVVAGTNYFLLKLWTFAHACHEAERPVQPGPP